MACAARALSDDQPLASPPRAGTLHLLARAANDNDPLANPTATTDPLTHTSNQTFDANRRVVLAIAPDPGTGARSAIETSYDALGRRQTLTFRDGSTQTWGGACPRAGQRPDPGDNADRVTSIAHVFPGDTGNNVTFTYGYDPVGREMSKSVDNAAYDYVPPAANVTYAAANALNQYPSVNSYPYSYWPEGGLKETDTLAANYDELGTMIEGFTTLTPGVIDPAYGEYVGVDALGHKYFHEAQTVAGQPYPFIYHSTDGLRPETILEWVYQGLNGAPQTLQGTRRYVLGPDPDERWAYIGPNGGTYNPHTDREGTLIALSNGGVVSRIYTWDPYGQNTSPADETSTGPAGYLYRYTGQRFDPATSLYDYKARDYSPALGRFYQPDPAGLDQGPNLYEYVGGNPLGAEDPSGMACDPALPCQTSNGPAHGAGVHEEKGTTRGGGGSNATQVHLPPLGTGPQPTPSKPPSPGDEFLEHLKNAASEIIAITLMQPELAPEAKAIESGLEGANFAQRTFSAMFSKGGTFAGQSVEDVAGALRSGALNASDVPIQYIVRDGNTLILNTRSAQALEQAGISRGSWKAINMTGDAAAEARLTGQLGRNGLTSQGIPTVVPGGN